MPDKPKILSTKTYSIKLIEYDNNTRILKRRNNGFSSFELIGIVDLIGRENVQMWSDILSKKLTDIERVAIVKK